MWDLKERIAQLLGSTGLTTGQLAQLMRERGDETVRGSQIRRELGSEKAPTPLWQRRLMLMAELLTKEQERQNAEVQKAVRRADKALSHAR